MLGDRLSIQDTVTLPADTTFVTADTLTAPQQGDIETTINYSAKDSIKFGVHNKIVYLYGGAKIDYGIIKLEAHEIELDWTTNTVTARGITDSLGNDIGMPVFHNGEEVYVTKGMKYNFETGRAMISEVVTQQGEGYIHGKEVFKNEDNELFSLDNSYTTCNLEHPHFRIRSKRTKAIPNDKIISGPFHLEINDVPTPLGFPFGIFPAKNESSSGVVVPSYGEERRRGFFLKEGGYFFDISDYVKVKLTGDIYSKGGMGARLQTNYKKRYAYSGSLNFDYTKLKLSDNIESEDVSNDFRLRWSHNPQSKRNSRFSASVSAATSSYNTNNNLGVNQSINRKLTSSINYSKTFQGTPFSMGLNLGHNQDVRTNQVDLILPDLSFNMENIYPFRKKGGSSKTWYQKMAVRWSMIGTNQLTNNLGKVGSDAATDSIAPFSFETLPTLLKKSKKGLKHSIPLSTSVKLLKYFTLSPNMNYTERWYFDKLDWKYDSAQKKAVADTISGFNRVYDYSVGAGISTRIYGTFHFKKGRVKAIRHVINPTIGFSYKPDFADPKFDYYQLVQNTSDSTKKSYLSRYKNGVYGSPGAGKTGSISMAINNTLEMKVKAKNDTTDQFKKIPLVNSFGISSSYNLVADSFKLAPINLRANTNLFENKMTISFSGSIDPYVYEFDSTLTNGRKIDEFTWNRNGKLGQLSSASLALSANLSPKSREKEKNTKSKLEGSGLSDDQKEYLINNPDDYVDFDIPWSLRINFNLGYNKVGLGKSNYTQSLSFSGDVSLSEKWKISYRSGYDFKNKDFTRTNIGIHRDLHCWEMNLNWVPFGVFQSYTFEIRVRSSLLQDLKLNKRRNFRDIVF